MSLERKVLISYGANPVRTCKFQLPHINSPNAKSDVELLIDHMFPIVTCDKKTLVILGGNEQCTKEDLIFFTFDKDFEEDVELSLSDLLPDKAKVTLKLRNINAGNQFHSCGFSY